MFYAVRSRESSERASIFCSVSLSEWGVFMQKEAFYQDDRSNGFGIDGIIYIFLTIIGVITFHRFDAIERMRFRVKNRLDELKKLRVK